MSRRSWASSGGVSPSASLAAPTIRESGLVDRFAQLLGLEDDGAGQPAHQVAAANLGLVLLVGGERGADRDLDLLGGALPHRDAVVAAQVVGDRGVDVEAADAHGLESDDAAHRDHGHLAGAAADVDHHVPERLVDGQRRADRGGHGLLDEVGLGGAGPAGRFEDGALLDVGDRGGHADQNPGALHAGDPGPGEDEADQPLGDLEVGDRAAAQRPDRHDVPGGAPDHVPRLVAHGEDVLGAAVQRDDGRLVEDDPLAPRVHEGVRGSEVDGEVARHGRVLLGGARGVDVADRVGARSPSRSRRPSAHASRWGRSPSGCRSRSGPLRRPRPGAGRRRRRRPRCRRGRGRRPGGAARGARRPASGGGSRRRRRRGGRPRRPRRPRR